MQGSIRSDNTFKCAYSESLATVIISTLGPPSIRESHLEKTHAIFLVHKPHGAEDGGGVNLG